MIVPLIVGFHPGYERNGVYSLEDVFSQLGNSWAVFDGDLINLASARLQVFRRSLRCVCCGIDGTHFAKERSARWVKKAQVFRATTETWHFNLYALMPNGTEVLMTKDHIVPRCKNGAESLDNLQTMCRNCNCKKGSDRVYQPHLPFNGVLGAV